MAVLAGGPRCFAYALAVLEVRLPPLREHLDDLPALVERFIAEPFSDMIAG